MKTFALVFWLCALVIQAEELSNSENVEASADKREIAMVSDQDLALLEMLHHAGKRSYNHEDQGHPGTTEEKRTTELLKIPTNWQALMGRLNEAGKRQLSPSASSWGIDTETLDLFDRLHQAGKRGAFGRVLDLARGLGMPPKHRRRLFLSPDLEELLAQLHTAGKRGTFSKIRELANAIKQD